MYCLQHRPRQLARIGREVAHGRRRLARASSRVAHPGAAGVDEVLRRASASGATVMLSSHELDRAQQLATKEVRLAGGVVVGDSQ